MSCTRPVSFETLSNLWSGDLAAGDAEAVEEHLFACDECAQASDRLAKLVVTLRDVVPPVISHAHRDRMARAGLRLRVTPVRSNVEAHAHFGADVDLLVHVLHGDLARAERVDLEVMTPEGEVGATLEHVPFDAKAGEVLIACQRHYRTLFSGDPTFRVLAVEGGLRREVGRYHVVHYWE